MGENYGFLQQGRDYVTLDWKRLSMISILFFSILFIDAIFLSYFLFNFYFTSFEEADNDFCLYDSYILYLETNEDPVAEGLCNNFFVNSTNFDKCFEFGVLQEYCQYVFVINDKVYPECDQFKNPDFFNNCDQKILNDVNYDYSDELEKIDESNLIIEDEIIETGVIINEEQTLEAENEI